MKTPAAVLAALAWPMFTLPAVLAGQEAPPTDRPVVKVLSGKPESAGHFSLHITYPPGSRTHPHYHSVDLTARVLRGRLLVGEAPRFDTTQVMAVEAESTVVMKAGQIHFDWWPNGGELAVEGEGPMTTVLVDSTGKPLPRP